jgi:hypothetical protein
MLRIGLVFEEIPQVIVPHPANDQSLRFDWLHDKLPVLNADKKGQATIY